MAYIAVKRLWHDKRLLLMRTTLSRQVVEARLASFAMLSTVKPTGDHGDVALEIEDQYTGAVIGAPLSFTHDDARALLGTHFHATTEYLARVLSDAYAQRYYAELTSEGPA